MPVTVERAPPRGLTQVEVDERRRLGLVNGQAERSSRSLSAIARANILTRFNAILGALLVVILVVGPLQDALFGIVLLTNTAIGIYQEWRAQRNPPPRPPPPRPPAALAPAGGPRGG